MRTKFSNIGIIGLILFQLCTWTGAAQEFPGEFAPEHGMVSDPEQSYRAEICLNGRWQFQPVSIPDTWIRNQGNPPRLSQPVDDGWSETPIKIPSPWNVNTWGNGRNVGPGTNHLYWPDSVYYPSYPQLWDQVEMAWLRREFTVPSDWAGRRIMLHFEAVAGDCEIRINQKPAGNHFDKYLPFELDITDLVTIGQVHELLVGVRAHSLFNIQSKKYPKMGLSYPCGSQTERLAGIWQDIFLLGLPSVRITDTFIKPLVDQNRLELDITIRNDTDTVQQITLNGDICPWQNLAGQTIPDVYTPNWQLDAPVLKVRDNQVSIAPGQSQTVTINQVINGQLKFWSPQSPSLYAGVLSLKQNSHILDKKMTRFGWRQFNISGSDLLLNGEKIQLYGDLLHPFGPFTQSRGYVWAWYKMIQDMGGNAVRPHAQIHPRCYLELADEMGLVVLDETAIFGSSIALNFEEPIAWQRFTDHYDGLILRDRNHPSVLGWSFGNELFAIFNLSQVSEEDANRWYNQLAELGLRARQLDPTRPWISCDGDEDLRGTMPVWSRHFGHGTHAEELPDIQKPLMVGESGGTYYARPGQLAMFNGSEAFASYAGRNEALAIDVYDNIVKMARPHLAYYSASETAWFGLEHLNFGYDDFNRLPGLQDGIKLTAAYVEGKPGIQPERIPPYVATLNPGWDSDLPLYKPLAMFHAQQAALAPIGPQACPWDHIRRRDPDQPVRNPEPTIDQVELIGNRQHPLARRLETLGVVITDQPTSFSIVDVDSINPTQTASIKARLDTIQRQGGVIWLMASGEKLPSELVALLPAPVSLTNRSATALVSNETHPWTGIMTLPQLYFAEEGSSRTVMKQGLSGPLVGQSQVLLQASNTDWTLFNTAPESAKCAAVVLYEHLQKPSGVAMIEVPIGRGRLLLSTLDYRNRSRKVERFWQSLLSQMGIRLHESKETATAAFDEEGVLLNALYLGRFEADNMDSALNKSYIPELILRPKQNEMTYGHRWQSVNSPSRDRFIFNQIESQDKPEKPFAQYLSFWIRSLRSLDNLLQDGPDAPTFTMFCYVSQAGRLWLDGKEITPTVSMPVDYRTLNQYQHLPLTKGWNHFLIKIASDQYQGDQPATLAVRIMSNNRDYFLQLDSAIEQVDMP